jgi:hypothetical protein
VIRRETSFHEQFLDVPIRKREPQIPTDRANNDVGFEMPPFEQRWRFDHGIHCSLSDSFTPFLQHCRLHHCGATEKTTSRINSGPPFHEAIRSAAAVQSSNPILSFQSPRYPLTSVWNSACQGHFSCRLA